MVDKDSVMLNGKDRIGQYPQGELFHAVQSQQKFACALMYIDYSEGSAKHATQSTMYWFLLQLYRFGASQRSRV